MAERLVLHVGTMKSGTTYLQTLLQLQRIELAEAGVLVPGGAAGAQASAVRGVLTPSGDRAMWEEVVRTIREHDGVAVLSQEYLGPAADAAARRVLDSLAGLEVQIVVTARDLNRTVVSMWQETIQNGRSWSWEDYLAAVRDSAPGLTRGVRDRATAGGSFWRQQHLARILGDWAARVGPERLTLVTVPPRGAAPTVLVERFARACGLTLRPLATGPRANDSLGLASIVVLRELNAALDELGIVASEGRALRKKFIAKTALSQLADSEPRLGLAVEDWVRRQSEDTIAAIRTLGVRVVGDLRDLEPADVPGIAPSEVSAEHRARAATVALVESVAQHPGVRDLGADLVSG